MIKVNQIKIQLQLTKSSNKQKMDFSCQLLLVSSKVRKNHCVLRGGNNRENNFACLLLRHVNKLIGH